MSDNKIHIVLYEIGQPKQVVVIPHGSTVQEILTIAKRQAKKVTNVSEWKEQPVLKMEDVITEDHSELFLGEHEHPKS